MKKLFLLLATTSLIFTSCETGGGLNEGENVDLPSEKIATIAEQSANINATIATLETTKSAMNATIASLNEQQPVTRGNDNDNNGVKDMIAALEERLAALEQMIANLKEYADGDLSEMQDWVEATFATMEQYNALASELATLKALLEGFEGVSTTELSDALAASEQSMKQWVNEQLSGYATIAEVEAQIAALKERLTAELNEEIEKVVATLTALMNDTKQEYEKAITEAIQNQGVINDKIAEDIANINKRIDEELATINKRLDDIEKRLDEIEEALANLIKQIQSLEYIDTNGDEPTPIVTSAEGAIVNLNFRISPKSAVADLLKHWESVVKVNAYYLNDISTIVDLAIVSFEGSESTGLVTIKASGENLSAEFYNDLQSASLYLAISDGNNDIESQSIAIKPQCWYNDSINVAPANNEIYYITNDNKTIALGDPNIVSNLYDWQKGFFVVKYRNDVTTIAQKLFYNCSSLTQVSLPSCVYSIGNNAFEGCNNLTNVNISDLSAWCEINFESNPLDSNAKLYLNGELVEGDLVIPNGTTSIGAGAFCYCNKLTSVTIPDSVTSIGQSAFYNCTSLTSVTIPDSVTSIGASAFYRCSNLKEVYCKPTTPPIGGADMFDVETTNIYIPANSAYAYTLAEYWKNYAKGQLVDYDFEAGEIIGAYQTNRIYYTATSKINLNGASHEWNPATGKGCVTYKSEITYFASECFHYCKNLTSITIPMSIKGLESGTFMGCENLRQFKGKFASEDGRCLLTNEDILRDPELSDPETPGIPDILSVKPIRIMSSSSEKTSQSSDELRNELVLSAFAPAGLTEYVIPNGVEVIGVGAFYLCDNLTKVTIPEGVEYIDSNAFANCTNLTSVTIPNSVIGIGFYAFSGCSSLTSITIPDSVIDIDYGTFYGCSKLTSFYGKFASTDNRCLIVNNEYKRGYLCSFAPAGLTEYTIPDGVATIAAFKFGNCSNLTNITIPSSVTCIHAHIFYDCGSLKNIYCKPTTPPAIYYYIDTYGKEGSFPFNSEVTIYVPSSAYDSYMQYSNYSNFGTAQANWSAYKSYLQPYNF